MIEATETSTIERTLHAEINLYYELHRPPTEAAPLLIALHGYGASKRQTDTSTSCSVENAARLSAPSVS